MGRFSMIGERSHNLVKEEVTRDNKTSNREVEEEAHEEVPGGEGRNQIREALLRNIR